MGEITEKPTEREREIIAKLKAGGTLLGGDGRMYTLLMPTDPWYGGQRIRIGTVLAMRKKGLLDSELKPVLAGESEVK